MSTPALPAPPTARAPFPGVLAALVLATLLILAPPSSAGPEPVPGGAPADSAGPDTLSNDSAADSASAAPQTGDSLAGHHPAILVGERLTFSIRYGVVRAGQAVMSVEGLKRFNGHLCYQIVTTASSNAVFDEIYLVRDRFVSLADRDRLFSRYSEKRLREGKYRADQAIRFDEVNGVATYQDGKTYEVPRGAFDVIAAFYYVRTMPLEVGQEFSIESHADRKNYPLKVSVLGREEVGTPAGRFRCLVVEPRLRSGAFFKNEGRLTLWLTDDERRMPVLMKSKISVGSISVVLTDWARPQPGKVEAVRSEPGFGTETPPSRGGR